MPLQKPKPDSTLHSLKCVVEYAIADSRVLKLKDLEIVLGAALAVLDEEITRAKFSAPKPVQQKLRKKKILM